MRPCGCAQREEKARVEVRKVKQEKQEWRGKQQQTKKMQRRHKTSDGIGVVLSNARSNQALTDQGKLAARNSKGVNSEERPSSSAGK